VWSSTVYRACFFAACLTLAVVLLAHGETGTQTAEADAAHSWVIHRQPEQLVNGAPVVFEVMAPVRLTALSGRWLEHEVFFSYDAAAKAWYGVAGVSLETRAGAYALELKGTTAGSAEIAFSQNIKVSAAKYPSIAVTVAKRFTEPSKEQLERIQQDKTVKHDVFGHTDPKREWSGKFRPPVDVPVSDVFGTRRTFNGKVQSMHQGLDYAAPTGTHVSAANSGTVLLAGPLYFEGNCVVLDHGQGLLTLYLHLSEIKVKQGEKVARGQEIGLSGGTGRATGPHLHLAVRWQGVYLNPATLLTLKLPDGFAKSAVSQPTVH
jgi:murein DD-endopeptidase MepM/ murein hydrolase activator NlpD